MTHEDKKFPILMGFVDGLLTALTLAAGKLFDRANGVDFSLALRVAIASLVSSGFVFFVARYSELRKGLIEAERELSLGRHLVSTTLGKKTLYTSCIDASISGISSCVGALLPLLIAAIIPTLPWLTLACSLLILALFGFFLGRSVGRRPLIWMLALILGGIFVIWVGVVLHLT